MKLIAFIIMILISFASEGQQATVTAGGNFSGPGGNISFSIGQPDFGIINNLNSGVQQVYNNGPFPLTWIGITASLKLTTIIVKWETAAEYNTSEFIVQRSSNGIDFNTTIDTVKAKGYSAIPSSYNVEDKNPITGVNYYRIKQSDKDNKFTYSAIVSVNYTSGFSVLCYPNPTNSKLIVDLATSITASSILLTDINGILLKTFPVTGRFNIIDLSSYQNGVYFLSILTGNKVEIRFSVIKQ